MLTKYHIRLSVENSRKNTLVKIINFTTQVELAHANLDSVICHFVKDNYRYTIEEGWKLSKTAKILTFEEALIAIRDFRFIESHIEEEEVEDYTNNVLCSIDSSFPSLKYWQSSPNTFCTIAIRKKSELKKVEEALFKVGFKKTKTEGTYYIKGNYALCITGNTPTNIILRRYYTTTKKVQKTIEL